MVQPEAVIRRKPASHGRLASAASTSDEADVAERRWQILRTNWMSLHSCHSCDNY